MKVFLTGASGVMGRSAIQALHDDGHVVVGLARSRTSAAVVEASGARVARGDVFHAEALTQGMQGCDAVVNLATKVPVGTKALLPGSLKAVDRIRNVGTQVVANAAVSAGVGRIVQQSLSFIYADQKDDWIDEHSPIDVTHATEPLVVAEEAMSRFSDDGRVAVSLRFGLIAGNDANSAWLVRRAKMGKPIGLGAEASWMHLVHPSDAGTAVVHALSAPEGIYNVGAEPAQRREYVDAIALAAGQREGSFLPSWVARVGRDKIEILTRSQRVSSQRFSDVTGWNPVHSKLTPDWFDELA